MLTKLSSAVNNDSDGGGGGYGWCGAGDVLGHPELTPVKHIDLCVSCLCGSCLCGSDELARAIGSGRAGGCTCAKRGRAGMVASVAGACRCASAMEWR